MNVNRQDGRVNRFERLDAASLKSPVRLDSGFLKVEGRIARVGIQEYRDSAGNKRRELRLPEEVFDQKSLESFKQLPVTNQHPPGMLNAKNAKQYSVGSLGENVRQDGDYVAAPLIIIDEEAISAAVAGRSQLSNGYSCWLDTTQDPALTKKWGEYDSIQREIRGNHCALVDSARAGSGACLRLDAGDAVAEEILPHPVNVIGSRYSNEQPTERLMAHKFKIDGLEVEVSDANVQSIVERAVVAARKAGEDLAAQERSRADAAQKQLSTLQAEHDTLKSKVKADAEKMSKCDECDGKGEVFGEKCDNCGGKGEVMMDHVCDAKKRADSINRMVLRGAKHRTALVVEARKHLGANEKLDSLPDLEIKKLVINKLDKDQNLSGKDEVYINHRFDFMTEQANKGAVHNIDRARTVQSPAAEAPREDELPSTDPNEARRKYIARQHNALVGKR